MRPPPVRPAGICCCCFTLRTGILILAALYAFAGLLAVSSYLTATGSGSLLVIFFAGDAAAWMNAVSIVGGILAVASSFAGFYAAFKYHLQLSVAFWRATAAAVVYNVVFGAQVVHYSCTEGSSVGQECSSGELAGQFMLYGLNVAACLYFSYAAWSFSERLRTETLSNNPAPPVTHQIVVLHPAAHEASGHTAITFFQPVHELYYDVGVPNDSGSTIECPPDQPLPPPAQAPAEQYRHQTQGHPGQGQAKAQTQQRPVSAGAAESASSRQELKTPYTMPLPPIEPGRGDPRRRSAQSGHTMEEEEPAAPPPHGAVSLSL